MQNFELEWAVRAIWLTRCSPLTHVDSVHATITGPPDWGYRGLTCLTDT